MSFSDLTREKLALYLYNVETQIPGMKTKEINVEKFAPNHSIQKAVVVIAFYRRGKLSR